MIENLEINRREFLQTTGITSAAFVLGFQLPLKGRKALASSAQYSHHYIVVGSQPGEFIFTMDKAEMGQGVITGQLTLFCEEADIAPQSVKVVSAPVDSVYGTMGGLQITGGSTSTKERWLVLRQVGANIRGTFLKAAAQTWSEDLSQLSTDKGYVISSSGKKISYNELAATASTLKIEEHPLKEAKNFKYIGKSTPKADAFDKSMGKAKYGVDFHADNLLTAIVLRCPTFGGKLKSFDKGKALQIPGIQHIVPISSGLAIVGEKYWQVSKARSLVNVEWDLGSNKNLSSLSIQDKYKKILEDNDTDEIHSLGEFYKVLSESEADEVIESSYELPYLAHATMEPMNASAQVTHDRVDIWAPNQGPTLIRNHAADFLGLPREQVFVHTTKYLGGGFGRRSTLDYPMEAVELAKAINKPVKVMWSREDDTQHSPMRPISRHQLKGIVKEGKALAWEHRLACESIMQGAMPRWLPSMLPEWVPSFVRKGVGGIADTLMGKMNVNLTTGEGAKIDYEVPHVKVSLKNMGLSIPIHFWRSVGHSYNGFVVESFMDELAHKAQKDPLKFRQDLLSQNHRALGVLNEVAKISKWGSPLPKGRSRGISYHYSFETYVAQVAEVEIVDEKIQVKKVYCAVDCGVAVNPEIIKDQMESGIIYGLSAALGGEITLANGAVQQSNFHDYPVLKISETPKIEVSIISSNHPPTGVGEPGLPPIAAAVGNALFSLTGKRRRSLPLKV